MHIHTEKSKIVVPLYSWSVILLLMPRPTDRSIDRRNEPNDPPLTRLSASIYLSISLSFLLQDFLPRFFDYEPIARVHPLTSTPWRDSRSSCVSVREETHFHICPFVASFLRYIVSSSSTYATKHELCHLYSVLRFVIVMCTDLSFNLFIRISKCLGKVVILTVLVGALCSHFFVRKIDRDYWKLLVDTQFLLYDYSQHATETDSTKYLLH